MSKKDKLHWCFNPFRIDETTTYYQNFFFLLWGIVFPMVVIFLLGLGSYLELGPLEFSWDQKGYDFFFDFYRFPIYLLPSVGVLGVTIARMHASKVRERGLQIAERKNDFDRRFKHEEEFEKYMGSSKPVSFDFYKDFEEFSIRSSASRGYYRQYFMLNITKVVDYTPSIQTFEGVFSTLNYKFKSAFRRLGEAVNVGVSEGEVLLICDELLSVLSDRFGCVLCYEGYEHKAHEISSDLWWDDRFWDALWFASVNSISRYMRFMEQESDLDERYALMKKLSGGKAGNPLEKLRDENGKVALFEEIEKQISDSGMAKLNM